MEDSQSGTPSPSVVHFQRQQHPLIGYYLSRKKLSKLRFDQFLLLCKRSHIETVELTNAYFEQADARIPQLIIHKLEDDVVSRSLTERIRSLSRSSTIILDEFDSIARLLNRYEQYSILDTEKNIYHVPTFIRVTADDNESAIEKMLIEHQITFPIMCKPIRAHGDKSHDMKLIFDVEHLSDIDKPCVLQQFIDHDGVLFKVFSVGPNNYHIVRRNSIRNLHTHTSRDTIAFRSNEVSSSQAAHMLLSNEQTIKIVFDHAIVNDIVKTVQNLFQLNLVGIDIIIDRNTGGYAVIDVNYFPGYEGVADFSTQLLHLCQNLLHAS
ncbi:unnamed protein product [Adineta ricciae]|uniref:Inositol-tetrakisphosphate 1-kinase n=1 Tax=Adineta ricciae TaxID=249248 RepID=A0A813RVL6_ADIRI|nr:unnamed protein product [Adineta ricciae]CAF1629011.1 unnamed protein product [Adineta ricciae]